MKTQVLLSPPDPRDYPVSAVTDVSEELVIPDDFEVWQPPVENQGSTGNCVAQSLANIMECIAHEYGEEHKDYSVGYIYGSHKNSASVGMYPREACDILLKEGDILRSEWECFDENPLCKQKRDRVSDEVKSGARKVMAYIRINTKKEMQAFMLKYNLPVMLIAQCTSFKNYVAGRHATVGYGWISKETYNKNPQKYNDCGEDNYEDILFTNSWGTGFHNKGRGACKFENMEEIWGIVPMEKLKLKDIKSRWSEADIELCVDRGIIKGYEDNTFKPTQQITREEVAALFARYIRQTDATIKELNKKIEELSK